MLKYAAVADLHVNNHKAFGGITVNGVNERGALCLETMESALHLAEEDRCTDFVVCGDFFDHIRPGPQLIAAVGRLLRSYPMRKWVIVGNHDQVSEAPGDHVLGPLGLVSDVIVVDTPRVTPEGEALMIPYRRGKVREWLPEVLDRFHVGGMSNKIKLVFAHFGIITGDTPPFLRDAEDAMQEDALLALMKKYDLTHVVVGNWHRPKIVTSEDNTKAKHPEHVILQCGSLIPSGFDDVDCNGNVVVVKTSIGSWHCLQPDPQPTFATFPWKGMGMVPEYLDDKKLKRPRTNTFVRCHSVPFTELGKVYELFERARDRGHFRDFEIEVGTSDARDLASPVAELKRNRTQLAQDYLRSVYAAESDSFRSEIYRRLAGYGAV